MKKIKKESRKPLGTSQNLFLLPKLASKPRMRNEDHYDFMPGIHWPHVETNPVREMRNIGRPSDMQRVKFKFYYYNYSQRSYLENILRMLKRLLSTMTPSGQYLVLLEVYLFSQVVNADFDYLLLDTQYSTKTVNI